MRCRPTKGIHHFLLVSILLVQIGCGSQSESSNNTSSADTLSIAAIINTPVCYAFVSATDTVELKLLIETDHSVSGELHYKLSGKDANHGSIRGMMKGDTIFADYNFMSEGNESVRQMIFLKSDSMVTEGYGPLEDVNGSMQFVKGIAPDFSKGLKLFLTNCKS